MPEKSQKAPAANPFARKPNEVPPPAAKTASAAPSLTTPAGRTMANAGHPISAAERRRLIAEAAYFIAERRGFKGGNDLQDWLAAEQQVDAQLRKQNRL